MGTRHLIVAIIDGEYKIAQYGQWDGYPMGQGVTVARFIQDVNIKQFKQKLRECTFLSSKSIRYRWKKVGVKSEWVTLDQAEEFRKLYPELSRDTGANILDLVHFEGKRKLNNSIGFASDSLFCEWAYVLNMDRNVLEVYKGFNHEPLGKKDRFYYMQEAKGPYKASGGETYFPIKCVAKIPFKEIDSDTMVKIKNKFDSEEE